jgi:formylglycine-generating enzyme required for sulfatase activity
MGSPASDALRDGDEVQHVASVGAYRISKYPITNKQYYAVTEQALPAALKGKEEYPVTNVTWMQARSFAQSIGGDLPTEAQWEYAARGGVRHENKLYSGSDNLGEVGVYQANSNGVMQPVGKKKANGLGLYDMSGNVWEWTLDTYLAYPGDDNPSFPVPSETYPAKVHRGGSYLSDLKECRVSERAASRGQEGGPDVGFRVVLPPAAE